MTNIHDKPSAKFIARAAEHAADAFSGVERAMTAQQQHRPALAQLRLGLAADGFDLACRYLETYCGISRKI
jgi:hypothetical protein